MMPAGQPEPTDLVGSGSFPFVSSAEPDTLGPALEQISADSSAPIVLADSSVSHALADISAPNVLAADEALLIQQRVDLAGIATLPATGSTHVADPADGPASCG